MRNPLALLLLVSTLASAGPSVAGEPPPSTPLVEALGHEDPYVRTEAARALLRLGFPAEDALARAVREGAPRLSAEAGHLGRTFLLAGRLAEGTPDEAAFWMALEEILTEVDPRLRDAVLALGLGASEPVRETLARRDRAEALVAVFVREWNENWTVGSEEEKRYATMQKHLVETGPAAVPHLLRVLAIDPRRAFVYLDPAPPGEVSARMQVRAIFGLSFLEAREALPFLLIQARGPSLTASSNAGAAFVKLAGIAGVPAAPFQAPDRAGLDAWWNEHRAEFSASRRGLERALLDDVRALLAQEFLGVATTRATGQILIRMPDELVHLHHRQAWLVDLVGLLSGVAPPTLAPETPVAERLARVTAFGEAVAHAR